VASARKLYQSRVVALKKTRRLGLLIAWDGWVNRFGVRIARKLPDFPARGQATRAIGAREFSARGYSQPASQTAFVSGVIR
jgi:hypothetical protein